MELRELKESFKTEVKGFKVILNVSMGLENPKYNIDDVDLHHRVATVINAQHNSSELIDLDYVFGGEDKDRAVPAEYQNEGNTREFLKAELSTPMSDLFCQVYRYIMSDHTADEKKVSPVANCIGTTFMHNVLGELKITKIDLTAGKVYCKQKSKKKIFKIASLYQYIDKASNVYFTKVCDNVWRESVIDSYLKYLDFKNQLDVKLQYIEKLQKVTHKEVRVHLLKLPSITEGVLKSTGSSYTVGHYTKCSACGKCAIKNHTLVKEENECPLLTSIRNYELQVNHVKAIGINDIVVFAQTGARLTISKVGFVCNMDLNDDGTATLHFERDSFIGNDEIIEFGLENYSTTNFSIRNFKTMSRSALDTLLDDIESTCSDLDTSNAILKLKSHLNYNN